jgi:hypothetical protein
VNSNCPQPSQCCNIAVPFVSSFSYHSFLCLTCFLGDVGLHYYGPGHPMKPHRYVFIYKHFLLVSISYTDFT